MDRLRDLLKFQFEVIHIQSEVPKKLVADIFVRINSEGVNLKAYDYILTWLSVFWPEGRETIEEFARSSRSTPHEISQATGKTVTWTPINPFINLEPGHIVRTMVAMGQKRARLQDAYAALQAKDRASGDIDSDRQMRELANLKRALPWVTDRTNWSEFIHAVQTTEFRSRQGITSTTNLVFAYIVFLYGRIRFRVDLPVLWRLVARWLFMSQMTSRYIGSGESQLQQDLDRFERVADGDAAGFVDVVERVLSTTLTTDFWRVSVPEALVSSGPALSPVYQCYLAALNTLDAEMFLLSTPRVRAWMDPSVPKVRGMEGHHLFPRNYLISELRITDLKRVNQVANFAPTDWDTNMEIGDRPPAQYWPDLVHNRYGSEAQMGRQMYWHALPAGWQNMTYDEFLSHRRILMAAVIREGYEAIGQTVIASASPIDGDRPHGLPTVSLQSLVSDGLLRPGDRIGPVDLDWSVDAVISGDATIVIDGTHTFDSLDDAAEYLKITNIEGQDFWALETDTGPVSLRDLGSSDGSTQRTGTA